jgi:hypothetical protein
VPDYGQSFAHAALQRTLAAVTRFFALQVSTRANLQRRGREAIVEPVAM